MQKRFFSLRSLLLQKTASGGMDAAVITALAGVLQRKTPKLKNQHGC
jgi:hypothetical protein